MPRLLDRIGGRKMKEELTTTDTHAPTFHLYEPSPTDDQHLFRMIDRSGDWTHYFQDEIQKYLPAVNHILDLGYPKGQRLLNYMRNNTAEAQEEKLTRAGEQGSRVHYAIRDLMVGVRIHIDTRYENKITGMHEKLTPREWDLIRSWVFFAQKYKLKILKHEAAIWHKKHLYAGTVDFLGTITIPEDYKPPASSPKLTKGQEYKVLLDWKTSAGIYETYLPQISAYNECLPLKGRPQFIGIVRLGTKHANGAGVGCGHEFVLYDKPEQKIGFQKFLNAKFNVEHEYKPFELPTEVIPSEFKLDIPQIAEFKKKKYVARETDKHNGKRKRVETNGGDGKI